MQDSQPLNEKLVCFQTGGVLSLIECTLVEEPDAMLKFLSIKLVMLSNHLILCRPLLLLPSISPSIRVISSVPNQGWKQRKPLRKHWDHRCRGSQKHIPDKGRSADKALIKVGSKSFRKRWAGRPWTHQRAERPWDRKSQSSIEALK